MTDPNFFQKLITNIVSSIKATVNAFAFNQLTKNGEFDVEVTHYAMSDYGYTSLGDYARTTFISGLFSRKSWLS